MLKLIYNILFFFLFLNNFTPVSSSSSLPQSCPQAGQYRDPLTRQCTSCPTGKEPQSILSSGTSASGQYSNSNLLTSICTCSHGGEFPTIRCDVGRECYPDPRTGSNSYTNGGKEQECKRCGCYSYSSSSSQSQGSGSNVTQQQSGGNSNTILTYNLNPGDGISCSSLNMLQMVLSSDGTRCLTCPQANAPSEVIGTIDTTQYPNANTNSNGRLDCNCNLNTQAIIERSQDGSFLETKQCQTCNSDYNPVVDEMTRFTKPQCSIQESPGPFGGFGTYSSYLYGGSQCPSNLQRVTVPGYGSSVSAGDYTSPNYLCYDEANEWTNKVNSVTSESLSGYSETAASSHSFNHIVKDLWTPSWWQSTPFGYYLGIQKTVEKTTELLSGEFSGSATINSATIKYLYKGCVILCNRGVKKGCECLSNICVLDLYRDDSTSCQLLENFYYKDTNNYPSASGTTSSLCPSPCRGKYENLPWISYGNTYTATTILESATKAFKDSGLSDVSHGNQLHFTLASYDLEGNYLGEHSVTNQLSLCAKFGGASPGSDTSKDELSAESWRTYSTGVLQECNIPLTAIFDLDICKKPVFYDLFITASSFSSSSTSGSSSSQYSIRHPVPVRILNTQRSGKLPNVNKNWNNEDDTRDDYLVRRFFLCDTASGRVKKSGSSVEESYYQQQNPEYIRWAANIMLEMRQQESGKVELQIPVLNIMYLDASVADYDSYTNSVDPPPLFSSFKVEYSGDLSGWWVTVTVFFILSLIFALVYSCLAYQQLDLRYPSEMVGFHSHTGAQMDPGLFMAKSYQSFLGILRVFFAVLFWFHFLMTFYWVPFYKGKNLPSTLLPGSLDGDQYTDHDQMLVTLIILSFLVLSGEIYRQCSVFIFILDREPNPDKKSKSEEKAMTITSSSTLGGTGQAGAGNQLQVPGGQSGSAQNTPRGNGPDGTLSATSKNPNESTFSKDDSPDKGISIWRVLFCGNELNERLASTRTSGYATWMSMVLFLDGFGWINSCRWSPDDDNNTAPYNPFLMYSITASTWILIISLQLFIRKIYSMYKGDEITNFIDVLSLANCSIWIQDEPFHGFYIHGRSPSGRGDVSATEMSFSLNEESHGLLPRRGLTPENPSRGDLQTFEFFLPTPMRDNVFNFYRQIQSERLGIPQSAIGFGSSGAVPLTTMLLNSNYFPSPYNIFMFIYNGIWYILSCLLWILSCGGYVQFNQNPQGGPPGWGQQQQQQQQQQWGQNNMGTMMNNGQFGGMNQNNMASMGGGPGPGMNSDESMNSNNFNQGGGQQWNMNPSHSGPFGNSQFVSNPGTGVGFGTGSMNMGNNSSNPNQFNSPSTYGNNQGGPGQGGSTNFFASGFHNAEPPPGSDEEPEIESTILSSDSIINVEMTEMTQTKFRNEEQGGSSSSSSPSSSRSRDDNAKNKRSFKIKKHLNQDLVHDPYLVEGSHQALNNNNSPTVTKRLNQQQSQNLNQNPQNQMIQKEGSHQMMNNTSSTTSTTFTNPNAGGGFNMASMSNSGVSGFGGSGIGNSMGLGGGSGIGGGATGGMGTSTLTLGGGGAGSLGGPGFGNNMGIGMGPGGGIGNNFGTGPGSMNNMNSFRGGLGGMNNTNNNNMGGGFGGGLGSGMGGMGNNMGMNFGGMGGPMGPMGGPGAGGASKKLAELRYRLQEFLIDTVDQVVRDQQLCIKPETSFNVFWGESVNVQSPSFPITFYEDHSSIKWSQVLAYGSVNIFGIPTGFEWILISFEFLVFSILFRFTLNIYLGVGIAFLSGQGALFVRNYYGEKKLSQTAMIDEKFFL